MRHALKTKHGRTTSKDIPSRLRLDTVAAEPVKSSSVVQTMSCQMNMSGLEGMAGELLRLGYREIDDALWAEVLVLYTCNIPEHAESKVYSNTERQVERKRRFVNRVTLVVVGCVAQQKGKQMLKRIPGWDLVLWAQYMNSLGDLLDDVGQIHCQVAATEPVHAMEDISKPRGESTATARGNVVYGCGENCTFVP